MYNMLMKVMVRLWAFIIPALGRQRKRGHCPLLVTLPRVKWMNVTKIIVGSDTGRHSALIFSFYIHIHIYEYSYLYTQAHIQISVYGN